MKNEKMSEPLWISTRLGNYSFRLLNMDHPDIEAAVLSEIESGVDVYYDRRWDAAEAFCHFLISQPRWVANRSVLILGAGIGVESLVVGRLCKRLYLNDYAAVALELCGRQLRENRIPNFELLVGPYETITCPEVDIVLGCSLVYNKGTLRAMRQFMNCCHYPIILINDPMPSFEALIKTTTKKIHFLPASERFPCALFEPNEGRANNFPE